MNRFKAKGLYLMCFIVIGILMNGCATAPSTPTDPRMLICCGFDVIIDSIAAPDAPSKGKTYLITSGMQDISDNDLQFQEFARYIANALSQKGYVRTDNIKNADLLIRFGYGIGAPQTSTKTVVTSYGYSYPVGWMWFSVPPSTKTVEKTDYMKTMIIEAYDLKDLKSQSQLWKTTAQTEGPQSDLRIMLAYIIAASVDYIGTNTGQKVVVNIQGRDPRVLNIWK